MKKKDVIKIFRIIIAMLIVVILAIFLWSMLPFMKELSTKEGQIAFKEKINSLGFNGILLLFGLQVLQILLVVLPGEPFEVLARYVLRNMGRIFVYNYICFVIFYNNFFYFNTFFLI